MGGQHTVELKGMIDRHGGCTLEEVQRAICIEEKGIEVESLALELAAEFKNNDG